MGSRSIHVMFSSSRVTPCGAWEPPANSNAPASNLPSPPLGVGTYVAGSSQPRVPSVIDRLRRTLTAYTRGNRFAARSAGSGARHVSPVSRLHVARRPKRLRPGRPVPGMMNALAPLDAPQVAPVSPRRKRRSNIPKSPRRGQRSLSPRCSEAEPGDIDHRHHSPQASRKAAPQQQPQKSPEGTAQS